MRRFFALITQLILLPISFLQTFFAIYPVVVIIQMFKGTLDKTFEKMGFFALIISCFVSLFLAFLINKIFYKIKGQQLHKSTYNESRRGYTLTQTTTTHDVYVGSEKVTSFDTNDYDLDYDDGWVTSETAMMKIAKLTSFIAIVFRVVAVIFAIIGLFTEKIMSSVHVPRIARKRGYNVIMHCLFDVIFFKS